MNARVPSMMKLVTSPASPFGRKVRVVAAELDLTESIEVTYDSPWKADTRVSEFNPVGKVPFLVAGDGMTLYDSSIITEYLAHLRPGSTLYPAGERRWAALRRAKLADQMLDAFIAVRLERNRAAGEQSSAWIERQRRVVGRCLDAMEREIGDLGADVTIAHVAFAVALAHLDFRKVPVDPDWREGHSALARWYETFAKRPSMRATPPRD